MTRSPSDLAADVRRAIAPHPCTRRYGCPICRDAEHAFSELVALVETLTQERDNHLDYRERYRDALLETGKKLTDSEAALADMRRALEQMLKMYERHAGWCGYNKNAPGDMIHRTATEAARRALAAAGPAGGQHCICGRDHGRTRPEEGTT